MLKLYDKAFKEVVWKNLLEVITNILETKEKTESLNKELEVILKM